MAHRRCLHSALLHGTALISLKKSPPLSIVNALTPKPNPVITTSNLEPSWFTPWSYVRHFSSRKSDDSENEAEMEDSSDVEEESDEMASDMVRDYSPGEKEAEAAAIGYKVVGPLQRSDRVFKDYEPVFAVVQIGSHQFKVSNGDSIFMERLKFCEVNDKALDAKVIIFKKKRRKNYRRTKGHRQELTKLRITYIQGIEKPEIKTDGKPLKAADKKPEKIAAIAQERFSPHGFVLQNNGCLC
ncbi:50S ribosomal protein L21, mitochondrial-like isoform X2 [Gossypium arboreum]|uniref:50S ribosomal protein L21, mitochondrial-like isoform X2 n=1 Tax=Gossypium arboreum TaxID=29729 RepID=UPI0022F1667D|nr:50S ribosomal protein L21, mitochondrial-like isoform X2 [Gossypium arboreum]